MRAGRLIAMLFALQDHGRMTAGQLATRLEVSERTVLRDVEALSEAGVPIYAVPGAGGGIELVDGFRTGLAAVTTAQAGALLLAGQPGLATVLGLGVAARSARGAVLRALPAALLGPATELDTWFLHDPLGPGAADEQAERLRLVSRAIRTRVQVRLDPDPRADPVRPLGLVLEAGRWHLVHLTGSGPAVLTLPDPLGPCLLGGGFSRPPDFDLTAWWGRRREQLAAVSGR